MKTAWLAFLALPLAAQQAAPPAEPWFTGSMDVGYRVVGRAGDLNTYRSVVNLGDGPKLFSLDGTIRPPKNRWADRIDIRANSWGGEPYNTARIDASRQGVYQFSWDYKNIAYYNFLPSFADPTAGTGILLDQRGYDSFLRTSDFELTLRPGHRIVPYVAYSRSGQRGQGTTNIVFDLNEYTMPDRLDSHSNLVRGGVRLDTERYHLTLEQGYMNFADGQKVLGGQGTNFGNRSTPFLGQQLFLTNGQQIYDVTGGGIFSRVSLAANPLPWATVYGQFLYSQIHSDANFNQSTSGNLADRLTLVFYSGQTRLVNARAQRPNPSGNVSIELRPWRKLRIVESWSTTRLHTAGSAFLTEQLLLSGGQLSASNVAAAERLVLNYNQQEVDAFYDVTSKITVRGGHRYVWGDASVPAALIPYGSEGSESGRLRRNVGLAGITYRTPRKLRVSADYEGSPGDRSYFRTSLNNYQRARIHASYQLLPSLSFNAHFGVLSNKYPVPGSDFSFLSRDNTLTVNWRPGEGKRLGVLAEYSRTTIASDITFRNPGTGKYEPSSYREPAHTGTLLADVALPSHTGFEPKLSFGGSFYDGTGTRPARYYQPFGRFMLPLGKHLQWNAEWRWYALTQPTYLYEGFRSHQFITGFRLSR